MCAIVDNDMRARFFDRPVDPELLPLWNWIDGRQGMLVVGGRLREELYRSATAGRAIQEWIRTRRAVDTEDLRPGEVEFETLALEAAGACRSNDEHVIALARVSGARLLCSKDQLLHQDFRNRELVSNPRGRVYQTSDHTHLLMHEGQCPLGAPNARGRERRR